MMDVLCIDVVCMVQHGISGYIRYSQKCDYIATRSFSSHLLTPSPHLDAREGHLGLGDR